MNEDLWVSEEWLASSPMGCCSIKCNARWIFAYIGSVMFRKKSNKTNTEWNSVASSETHKYLCFLFLLNCMSLFAVGINFLTFFTCHWRYVYLHLCWIRIQAICLDKLNKKHENGARRIRRLAICVISVLVAIVRLQIQNEFSNGWQSNQIRWKSCWSICCISFLPNKYVIHASKLWGCCCDRWIDIGNFYTVCADHCRNDFHLAYMQISIGRIRDARLRAYSIHVYEQTINECCQTNVTLLFSVPRIHWRFYYEQCVCLANDRVNSLHARRMRRTATFSYAQNRLAIVIGDYRNTRAVFYFRLFPPSVYFFSFMPLSVVLLLLLLLLPIRLYTHFRFGFILIGRATTSYSSRANASLYLHVLLYFGISSLKKKKKRFCRECVSQMRLHRIFPVCLLIVRNCMRHICRTTTGADVKMKTRKIKIIIFISKMEHVGRPKSVARGNQIDGIFCFKFLFKSYRFNETVIFIYAAMTLSFLFFSFVAGVFANVVWLCECESNSIISSEFSNCVSCGSRNAFGFSASWTRELHIFTAYSSRQWKNPDPTEIFPQSISVCDEIFETHKCRRTQRKNEKKKLYHIYGRI